MENGKAQVIQEELCDGAGACLAVMAGITNTKRVAINFFQIYNQLRWRRVRLPGSSSL